MKSEAAIQGANLRDNSLYRVAEERLDASCFSLWNNRILWAILQDLIDRAGCQGVGACQLATLHGGERLAGFEKEDREEIRAWLLDLQRNRWTRSLAEHVKKVVEASEGR